jgi:hypothetical protein
VRERDVLQGLCRPLLDRDMFTEPASTRAIAEELVITQAAVKQHVAKGDRPQGDLGGDRHATGAYPRNSGLLNGMRRRQSQLHASSFAHPLMLIRTVELAAN